MSRTLQACLAGGLGCVAFLYAQDSAQDSASMRQFSAAWRQTEPLLESDAGAPSPQFESHLKAAVAAEKTYADQRREFLLRESKQATAAVGRLQAIDTSAPSPIATRPESGKIVDAATQVVTRTAAGLAGSRDPAIIRFRQAVDLERVALASIGAAIEARQKASATTSRAATALDTTQAIALRAYRAMADTADKTSATFARESEAWDVYYAALTSAGISPASPTGAAIRPNVGGPAAATAILPVTPRNGIPVSRYVGDWNFPASGLFHGPEPQSVDMMIQLDNGRLSGVLTAKFLVPAKSPLNPVVKFEFSGTPMEGRTQSFALRTPEGAQGTIDLIPGRAFNLLEINFQINPVIAGQVDESKISTANFVLLKQ